jgi:hypothetical protein
MVNMMHDGHWFNTGYPKLWQFLTSLKLKAEGDNHVVNDQLRSSICYVSEKHSFAYCNNARCRAYLSNYPSDMM